jgi:hypothetical protein
MLVIDGHKFRAMPIAGQWSQGVGNVGDDVSVLPLVLEEPPIRSTDDRIDTLVGVVTDLVSRVDSTQRQLDSLQLTLSTHSPVDDMACFRAQGAIPRCSAAGASASYPSASELDQHSEPRAAQGAVQNHMPTMPELRTDQGAVQQAAKLVNCMDLGATGITNIHASKTMR